MRWRYPLSCADLMMFRSECVATFAAQYQKNRGYVYAYVLDLHGGMLNCTLDIYTTPDKWYIYVYVHIYYRRPV